MDKFLRIELLRQNQEEIQKRPVTSKAREGHYKETIENILDEPDVTILKILAN